MRDYRDERNSNNLLNGFEDIVENVEFAHYDQMFHFPYNFQTSATKALLC